jgi:hypothetical protein
MVQSYSSSVICSGLDRVKIAASSEFWTGAAAGVYAEEHRVAHKRLDTIKSLPIKMYLFIVV